MENYGTLWLKETGNKLDDFDGICNELADEIIHWLDKKKIPSQLVWIGPNGKGLIVAHYPPVKEKWYYHVVIESKGRIHDPWKKGSLIPYRYFASVFPKQTIHVEYRNNNNLGFLSKSEVRYDGKLISKR